MKIIKKISIVIGYLIWGFAGYMISSSAFAGCKSGCYNGNTSTCNNGPYVGNYTCSTLPTGVYASCCYTCMNGNGPDITTYCHPQGGCTGPVTCATPPAQPNNTWTVTSYCQTMGMPLTSSTPNAGACVATGYPSYPTGYSPPAGTTTTHCAVSCPIPTSNQAQSNWKGKCQYGIMATACTPQIETSVVYQGDGKTYYTCTPGTTVGYYGPCYPAPSSSSAPGNGAVEEPKPLRPDVRSDLIPPSHGTPTPGSQITPPGALPGKIDPHTIKIY